MRDAHGDRLADSDNTASSTASRPVTPAQAASDVLNRIKGRDVRRRRVVAHAAHGEDGAGAHDAVGRRRRCLPVATPAAKPKRSPPTRSVDEHNAHLSDAVSAPTRRRRRRNGELDVGNEGDALDAGAAHRGHEASPVHRRLRFQEAALCAVTTITTQALTAMQLRSDDVSAPRRGRRAARRPRRRR